MNTNKTFDFFDKNFRNLAYFDIVFYIFLLIFGTIINFFYLIVILLTRKRPPRIGGKKYLIILTLSSLIYINLHFFIYITTYKKYLYDTPIDFLIDSNKYICKIVTYSRLVSRCLFTFATLGYSLERTLAIFFPFKIMVYKNSISNTIFSFVIFASIFSPFFTLFFYKIKEFQCDIDIEDWKRFSKHTFYLNLFTGVIPFILNIFLNMVILIKLNKYQLIVSTRIGRTEILKILNRIYEENFSIIQTKLSPFNRIRHFKKVFHIDETNFFFRSKSKTQNTSIDTSNVNNENIEMKTSYNNSREHKNKKTSFLINHQFTNTKFFVLITSLNLILNIPYCINTCVLFNPFFKIRMGDPESVFLANNYYFFMYLVFSELVSTAKYSFTIFFFTFNKNFRMHLNDIINRYNIFKL
jgi:hypothetical protein